MLSRANSTGALYAKGKKVFSKTFDRLSLAASRLYLVPASSSRHFSSESNWYCRVLVYSELLTKKGR